MAYKAAIISIGNEILLGKTVNTNLAWLGSQLAKAGLPVEYSVTIKDERADILEALENCWEKYDLVISTGGLGPTADDITKASVAEFFGKELVSDAAVWQHVQSLFAKRKMPTPSSNRSQAMVPEGFSPLPNAMGTAPGLHYSKGKYHYIALPGVPFEMKHLYESQILPVISENFPRVMPVHQQTINTYGISESALAEMFGIEMLPDGVNLAWLPQTGRVDLRFYGTDAIAIEKSIDIAKAKIGQYFWGFGEDNPARILLVKLKTKGYTLAVAESCTGGWVQKLITDIPGASQSFMGGVVSYHNDIKAKVLHVEEATLEAHGAVSTEVALAMVNGLVQTFGSDVGIAITGIAGPEGGTEEKPVGLVHFAFYVRGKLIHKKIIFGGNRDSIRHKAAESAILLCNSILEGSL